MAATIRLHIRDGDAPADIAIGPGKIALLEAIRETGSIRAAARRMGMSYRRAWVLVDETNRCLVRPAVAAASGGERGGGAALTPTGEAVVARYRELEAVTRASARGAFGKMLRARPLPAQAAAKD